MPISYISDEQTIGLQQEEIDTLHAENALKLTQILNLEQLLYDVRYFDDEDGSPCFCANIVDLDGTVYHSDTCIEAREATEPFWKKPTS